MSIRQVFRRFILYPWQRIHRGYSDADLWSLDAYLAQVMSHALRDLATKPVCVPLNAKYERDEAAGPEHWQRLLEEMSRGFEMGLEPWGVQTDEERAALNRSYALLAEWHSHLWW